MGPALAGELFTGVVGLDAKERNRMETGMKPDVNRK